MERILDHRTIRVKQRSQAASRIELLIKWEGYLSSDNTWEPLHEIFFDIRALVRKYFLKTGFKLNCK